MPFSGISPEALLSRNDSKNPATTCKGITANGRPCRRALAASPQTSPAPSPGRGGRSSNGDRQGVLAVLEAGETDGNHMAAFYCWQHKDQAQSMAAEKANHTNIFPLTKRSSIDTIVDRLGILDIDEARSSHHKKKRRRPRDNEFHSGRRDNLPEAWQEVPGPLMTVPESALESPMPTQQRPSMNQTGGRPQREPRSNVKASFLCCIRAVDDESYPPPRRHKPSGTIANARPQQSAQVHNASEMVQRPAPPAVAVRPSPRSPARANLHPNSLTNQPHQQFPGNRRTSSQTQSLLSYIPTYLSPQTTSLLLTELGRPISSADEAGYIYMFWLTPPEVAPRPDDETASMLLTPPLARPDTGHRRGSDALQAFASSPLGRGSRTVLLKIGRAANVHRRLNQWTKQCGYNVTLIRYYPYHSLSSGQASSPSTPRQVPHVHRVERLIHLELADKRAKDMGVCGNCGREHREWFEVDANRQGLKHVDDIIRRWVSWAEEQQSL